MTLPVFYPGQVGADEIRANPSLDRAVREAASNPTDARVMQRLVKRLGEEERAGH